MPKKLIPYYKTEVSAAACYLKAGDFSKSWYHLERAHIIGQKYPVEHSYVHWKMLQFGFRIKNGKEILGQFPRLLVGGIKSFVDYVPVGNTGGADVQPLRSMELPSDIRAILHENLK